MSCCPSNITFFFEETETVVAYTQPLQAAYGPQPEVSVLYWDEFTEQYVAAGIFTEIKLEGIPINTIRVNHGGPAQGFLKLS